jgi:hypothetical protein
MTPEHYVHPSLRSHASPILFGPQDAAHRLTGLSVFVPRLSKADPRLSLVSNHFGRSQATDVMPNGQILAGYCDI